MTQSNVGVLFAVACLSLWACSGDGDRFKDSGDVSDMPSKPASAGMMTSSAPEGGSMAVDVDEQNGGSVKAGGNANTDMPSREPSIPDGPSPN